MLRPAPRQRIRDCLRRFPNCAAIHAPGHGSSRTGPLRREIDGILPSVSFVAVAGHERTRRPFPAPAVPAVNLGASPSPRPAWRDVPGGTWLASRVSEDGKADSIRTE